MWVCKFLVFVFGKGEVIDGQTSVFWVFVDDEMLLGFIVGDVVGGEGQVSGGGGLVGGVSGFVVFIIEVFVGGFLVVDFIGVFDWQIFDITTVISMFIDGIILIIKFVVICEI